MAGGNKFDKNDDLADLIARGVQLAHAAALVGISKSTAKRRTADPVFRQRVAELRAQRLERTSAAFSNLLETAGHALHRGLVSDDVAVSTRAARVVIDAATRLHELTQLQRQVAEHAEAIKVLQARSLGPVPGLRIIPVANGDNHDTQK